MKRTSWRKFLKGASLQRDLEEIRSIVIRYVKDETVQPLKEMGRFAAFGAAGSLFVGFGTVLILLGVLRFLQEQFPVLNGSLSWIPYLVVVTCAAGVIALTAWRIMSGTSKRRLKDEK